MIGAITGRCAGTTVGIDHSPEVVTYDLYVNSDGPVCFGSCTFEADMDDENSKVPVGSLS